MNYLFDMKYFSRRLSLTLILLGATIFIVFRSIGGSSPGVVSTLRIKDDLNFFWDFF